MWDAGVGITPRYTFTTGPVPEPPPFEEDLYGTPVPLIDDRPITFDIKVHLSHLYFL